MFTRAIRIVRDSAAELKSVRVLTMTAMLTALNVILGFFSIPIGDLMKFNLSFIPNAILGAMFGPVPAALSSGAADILKAVLKPTGGYFPGFTISAVIVGLCYGLFLYKNRVTLRGVILCEVTHRILAGILLYSFWMTLLAGDKAIWYYFPARLIQNAILLPIAVAMIMLMQTALSKIFTRTKTN